MRQPFKCPVCLGKGVVSAEYDPGYTSTAGYTTKTCNACQGSGVVWSPEDTFSVEWKYQPQNYCVLCGKYYVGTFHTCFNFVGQTPVFLAETK